MKYVYCYERIGNGIFRYEIIKETKSNIWIKKPYGEKRVSKKSMSTGEGWDRTHYYFETPDLLEKYNKYSLSIRYLKKLEILKNCKDETIMQYVLNIELPENINPAQK